MNIKQILTMTKYKMITTLICATSIIITSCLLFNNKIKFKNIKVKKPKKYFECLSTFYYDETKSELIFYRIYNLNKKIKKDKIKKKIPNNNFYILSDINYNSNQYNNVGLSIDEEFKNELFNI